MYDTNKQWKKDKNAIEDMFNGTVSVLGPCSFQMYINVKENVSLILLKRLENARPVSSGGQSHACLIICQSFGGTAIIYFFQNGMCRN